MKIGIISNSKICLPILANLAGNKSNEILFYWGKTIMPDVPEVFMAGFCSANGINLHKENKKEDLYQWQLMHQPDILFVSGYAHKIDVKRLAGITRGLFNIHFGKLPEYRGPSPVFWSLKNGEPELTITIHHMAEDFDTGDIAWTFNIKTEEYHTYNYVYQILSELQVRGVVEILEKIARDIPIAKKTQNESLASYYGKPGLAEVLLNWDKMDAPQILNTIKACNAWNLGAITLINNVEVKIIDAVAVNINTVDYHPGTIIIDNFNLFVACKNKAFLAINFLFINNTYVPARHAPAYGLQTGQKFMNNA
jgi:methionyl-tRNA formyltransferase